MGLNSTTKIKWAKQLRKDHDYISWLTKANLSKVSIKIISGKSTLGYWDESSGTIAVSSHLILKG